MVIGLSDSRASQSRGRIWRILKRSIAISAVMAVAVSLFGAGVQVERSLTEDALNRVAAASKTVEDLKARVEEAQGAAKQAAASEAQWRSRYEQEVPTGPGQTLHEIVLGRLKAGVPPDRLAAVIGAITEKRSCDKPERAKRVLVRVPTEPGQPPPPPEEVEEPQEPAGFVEGVVTVTAEGKARFTPRGTRMSGYDPERPVAVRFAVAGGGGSVVSAVLPIRHPVTIGDNEFRFTITADRWRHVVVAVERCKSP